MKQLIILVLFAGIALLLPSGTYALKECVVPNDKFQLYQQCLQTNQTGLDCDKIYKTECRDVCDRDAYNQCLSAGIPEASCRSTYPECVQSVSVGSNSSIRTVFGTIQIPVAISKIGLGKQGIDNIVRVGIGLAFAAGALLCLAFVIWGAMDIITSGANKEGMAGGQKKITYALIGLALLGLSFVIVRVVAGIVGLGSIIRF